MPKPSLFRLTVTYLRIGGLTFGGGDPTMAALQNELTRRRGWLSAQAYALAYALARITPGTNMLAFVAGSAWMIAGWAGALAAVMATTLPSAIIVALLSAGYDALRLQPRAMAAIGGTLAAAVGMMAAGAWQLLEAHLRSRDRRRVLRAAAFAGAAFALSHFARATPVVVLGLAAAAGAFWRGPEEA